MASLKKLKFDSINSLATNPVKYTLPIVTLGLIGGISIGLACLWDSGSINSMIKCKHINPYKFKLRANKVNYSMVSGPYKITHNVKVIFIMP